MDQKEIMKHLKDATDIKCEKCGSLYFKEVLRIKKISKLISGQPKDTVVPLPVLACTECGHINDDMNVG